MTIHENIPSLLKESLLELIFVAEYCVDYRKTNPQWPKGQVSGCLGFPASILLFSIVDAIGSYYREDKDFRITVDGNNKRIRNDSFQHFYILNSDYYNKQGLSEGFIKKIYNNYRSLLIHNAALPFDHFLEIGNSYDKPFEIKTNKGKDMPIVKVLPFLNISKEAVKKFIQKVDTLSESKQMKGIEKRK
ncbi:MAG: hypothetical protein AAB893_02370 [Patescibacteria group bacterium]